jgi:hypothetical protein
MADLGANGFGRFGLLEHAGRRWHHDLRRRSRGFDWRGRRRGRRHWGRFGRGRRGVRHAFEYKRRFRIGRRLGVYRRALAFVFLAACAGVAFKRAGVDFEGVVAAGVELRLEAVLVGARLDAALLFLLDLSDLGDRGGRGRR